MNNDSPIKVLTIDDEELIRETIGGFLEDCGFQVLKAESAKEGLDIFRRQQPDIVLVDLRMPGTGGLEVVSFISQASPETPVIVVSGTGVIADAIAAVRRGAWDFILKPIKDMDILLHTINKAMDKAILIQENRAYQSHLEKEVAQRTAELTQINERMRLVVETSKRLTFCPDMGKLGKMLLVEFGRHMAAEGGSLYFVEEKGLRLAHSMDPGHAPDFIPFPLRQGSLLNYVFQNRQPALISDPRQMGDFDTSGWKGYKDQSVIIFPLEDKQGRVMALISLHNKTTPPFTRLDKEVGQVLASFSCEALRATKATEALTESLHKYRLLAENLQDVVLAVSPNGRLTYCSPAIRGFGGYEPSDTLGMPFGDFMADPIDAALVDEFIRQIARNKESNSMEFVFKPMQGEAFPVEVTAKPLLLEGAVVSLQCVMRNIKERKDAEKARQRLERLYQHAQKMEAIGTLAGGIAHDFNNILGAILGYTELSLMGLNKEGRVRESLNQIHSAAMRAKDLVKQVLTFSRQEEQTTMPVRMDLLIKETARFLRASFPSTIEIHYDLSPDLLLVMGDPTRIHQVLMNLGTNAHDAMVEKGGTLYLGLDSLSIESKKMCQAMGLTPGFYVHLTVKDSGVGIDKEVLERIFEPYFTTKERGKGTGLGLAVTHGVIKAHGGAITVESNPGRGTVFHVYLPATQADKAQHVQKEEESLPQGKERILFVDDEKMLADSARQILEGLGYSVEVYLSPVDALENFLEHPALYDLVISDMTMPHMTGEEMAAKILGIREDIPVFLCTGFSEKIDKERAAELGIKKILYKPVSMADLAGEVRKTLDAKG